MGRGTSKAGGGGSSGKQIKAKTYALFHGSPSTDIEEFDLERAGENTRTDEKFLFFTDKREAADEFRFERIPTDDWMYDRVGKQGKVYEVDVTLNNPLDFSNLTPKDREVIKKLKRDYVYSMDDDKIDTYSKYNNQAFKYDIDINRISEFGYDGFIADMGMKNGAKEYAVINPKQVKIRKKR